jgi:hypothetical protein
MAEFLRHNYFSEGNDVGDQWIGAGDDDPFGAPPPDPTTYKDADSQEGGFYGGGGNIGSGGGDVDSQEGGFYGGISNAVDDAFGGSISSAIFPEEARSRSSGMASVMQYPDEVTSLNQFISFYFQEIVRPGPLAPRRSKPAALIVLPIPTNLVEQFNMQYNEKKYGTALGLLEKAGAFDAATISQIAGGGQQGIDKTRELTKSVIDTVKSNVGLTAAVQLGIRNVVGDGIILSAIERASGAILNPYQALQFDGIQLRAHTFSYRFSPKSASEAASLKEIINEFKIRMHPEKDGLLLTYPDVCQIGFAPDSAMPYKFEQSFLESMTVNYAPSNTPAFFKGGEYPAEIEITLNFRERVPVTKEFFEDAFASFAGGGGMSSLTEGSIGGFGSFGEGGGVFGGDVDAQDGGFYGGGGNIGFGGGDADSQDGGFYGEQQQQEGYFTNGDDVEAQAGGLYGDDVIYPESI